MEDIDSINSEVNIEREVTIGLESGETTYLLCDEKSLLKSMIFGMTERSPVTTISELKVPHGVETPSPLTNW